METDKIEQVDAYLAGELQQDAARLVEAGIRGDQVAEQEFVVQAQMDAALKALMSEDALHQNFVQGVMASVQAEPERALTKSVLTEILDERDAAAGRHQPKPFDWWVWTKTAAIAAVAAAATVWTLQSVRMDSGREGQAAPQPKFLARLSADENAQWAENSLKAREDGWLGSGRLDLRSGQAEVTFGSGARVLLEGPVVFDVEQMNRGFLKRGRLTAEVPGPASGFVINTPLMNVIDLGTRFGLNVKHNGESDVHVMQGVVEVSRARGRSVPLVLTEGLAVLADRRPQSRLKPVIYAGHDFVLPEQEASVLATGRFLHYGFDESGGAEIDDTGVGMSGGPFDISLLADVGSTSDAVDSINSSPKRTAGAVGRGLVFEAGDRLQANGPSLLAGGTRAWSVMLWTKVLPKADKNGGQEMLVWGSPQQHWRMRWNDEVEAGTEGALRADFGEGYVVGATDLRDGRWHHVALVFIGEEQGGEVTDDRRQEAGGDKIDVATHVRLYVDGKLEPLSGGRSQVVEPLPGADESGLSSFSLGGAGGFEGWLDEFYLFDAAASSANVLELYKMGALETAGAGIGRSADGFENVGE